MLAVKRIQARAQGRWRVARGQPIAGRRQGRQAQPETAVVTEIARADQGRQARAACDTAAEQVGVAASAYADHRRPRHGDISGSRIAGERPIARNQCRCDTPIQGAVVGTRNILCNIQVARCRNRDEARPAHRDPVGCADRANGQVARIHERKTAASGHVGRHCAHNIHGRAPNNRAHQRHIQLPQELKSGPAYQQTRCADVAAETQRSGSKPCLQRDRAGCRLNGALHIGASGRDKRHRTGRGNRSPQDHGGVRSHTDTARQRSCIHRNRAGLRRVVHPNAKGRSGAIQRDRTTARKHLAVDIHTIAIGTSRAQVGATDAGYADIASSSSLYRSIVEDAVRAGRGCHSTAISCNADGGSRGGSGPDLAVGGNADRVAKISCRYRAG